MPWGDGTGPWWAQGRGWRCWRRYPRGFPVFEPLNLTKEEQKKILEAELKDIEIEKQEIEKRLKEL